MQASETRRGLWKILDDPTTKFLLTTFLIPLCIFVYTYYTNRRADAAKQQEIVVARAERIERMDTEISFRLGQILVNLEQVGTAPPAEQPKQVEQLMAAITAKAQQRQDPSLYPAFAEHSLLSLLGELRSDLIASGIEAERMAPAGPGTVNETIRSLSVLTMRKPVTRTPKQTASDMLDVMHRVRLAGGTPRWDRGFIYTDCNSTNPFC